MTEPRRLHEQRLPATANPEAGEVGYTLWEPDPRCTGACGVRSGRPLYDSPAKTGRERGTGRRIVYCPCCSHELKAAETIVDNVRPPNLNPGLVAGKHIRFVDDICGYDAVLLFDVKEA